jgi:hypothetical protein
MSIHGSAGRTLNLEHYSDENLWGVDDQWREEVGYYFGAVTKDQRDGVRKKMGGFVGEYASL